jgi:hypothetical protein
MKIRYIKNFNISKYLSSFFFNRGKKKVTVNVFNPDYPNLHNDLKFCIVDKIIGIGPHEAHEWILCKIKKDKIPEYDGSDIVVTQAFIGVKFTGDKEKMTPFEIGIRQFMTDNFPEAYI